MRVFIEGKFPVFYTQVAFFFFSGRSKRNHKVQIDHSLFTFPVRTSEQKLFWIMFFTFKTALLLGCLWAKPSYYYGFRSSPQKNVHPGKGTHEGLVPRNDDLTIGFIRFSLARTLARTFFVPRRLPPPPPSLLPRNPEGVANQGYLRCSKRFDHRSHFMSFVIVLV